MCGIVGIVNPSGPRTIRKMLDRIAHRGPDEKVTWVGKRAAIGHARLAILDPKRARQPMADRSNRTRIVHNGEIYNFRELRKLVPTRRFTTRSDTETLLALSVSEREPETWISHLDGMFAFAIVSNQGLLLARDPLGVKPLYVGHTEDGTAFASEIKALLEVTQDVHEFPPGHVFTTSGGLRPFYKFAEPEAKQYDPDSAASDLLVRLTRAVRSRLLADVPVGVFLSGGLDSSLIAALARRAHEGLQTFAVGMEDGEDILAARRVAEFLGTRHYERIFTVEEALAVLPTVIYHLESFDCALVRSAIPNYFLAEMARERVKVALSGEGADELFAGYAYLRTMPAYRLTRELREITLSLHNTNLQRCDRMSMAHGLEVRVPFLDDLEVVRYAFRIPIQFKMYPPRSVEKWILRKIAVGLLPDEIVTRRKQKFAHGAGLGDALERYAESKISDSEFADARAKAGVRLRSKEELMYYRLFKRWFPSPSLEPLVGRSRSV